MRLYRVVLSFLLLFVALTAGMIAASSDAHAIPSFARQTGQPCSACHTAFPELTPFGRAFKLHAYSFEGGDSKLPRLAGMVQTTFTNYAKSLSAPAGNGLPANDQFNPVQQFSLFYGGKLFENAGAFIQTTYAHAPDGDSVSIDNADIRYADDVTIGGHDVLFGVTLNNVPTVQDVWNSTPVWQFPYISSGSQLGPMSAGPVLDGGFGAGETTGAGLYTMIDDLVYGEISAYGRTPSHMQTLTGLPEPTSGLSGLAPYWRFALEPKWGDHALMIGTFGMISDINPDFSQSQSDHLTDIGFDTQYQWIGDKHAITARAAYIDEWQKLDASYTSLAATGNLKNEVQSLHASLSYIYDHAISVTGGVYRLTGSPDAVLYSFANTGNLAEKPNSQGYIFDLAYMPFSDGGPSVWKEFNARIGISYTTWTEIDGGNASTTVDGTLRKAGDNNTLMLYAWTAF